MSSYLEIFFSDIFEFFKDVLDGIMYLIKQFIKNRLELTTADFFEWSRLIKNTLEKVLTDTVNFLNNFFTYSITSGFKIPSLAYTLTTDRLKNNSFEESYIFLKMFIVPLIIQMMLFSFSKVFQINLKQPDFFIPLSVVLFIGSGKSFFKTYSEKQVALPKIESAIAQLIRNDVSFEYAYYRLAPMLNEHLYSFDTSFYHIFKQLRDMNYAEYTSNLVNVSTSRDVWLCKAINWAPFESITPWTSGNKVWIFAYFPIFAIKIIEGVVNVPWTISKFLRHGYSVLFAAANIACFGIVYFICKIYFSGLKCILMASSTTTFNLNFYLRAVPYALVAIIVYFSAFLFLKLIKSNFFQKILFVVKIKLCLILQMIGVLTFKKLVKSDFLINSKVHLYRNLMHILKNAPAHNEKDNLYAICAKNAYDEHFKYTRSASKPYVYISLRQYCMRYISNRTYLNLLNTFNSVNIYLLPLWVFKKFLFKKKIASVSLGYSAYQQLASYFGVFLRLAANLFFSNAFNYFMPVTKYTAQFYTSCVPLKQWLSNGYSIKEVALGLSLAHYAQNYAYSKLGGFISYILCGYTTDIYAPYHSIITGYFLYQQLLYLNLVGDVENRKDMEIRSFFLWSLITVFADFFKGLLSNGVLKNLVNVFIGILLSPLLNVKGVISINLFGLYGKNIIVDLPKRSLKEAMLQGLSTITFYVKTFDQIAQW